MEIRVDYKEYKNRYEGFEKSKMNYDKENKTIEIVIADKIYDLLQGDNKKHAALALDAILLLSPSEKAAKEYTVLGSKTVAELLKNKKHLMGDNQIACTEKIVEILTDYGL